MLPVDTKSQYRCIRRTFRFRESQPFRHAHKTVFCAGLNILVLTGVLQIGDDPLLHSLSVPFSSLAFVSIRLLIVRFPLGIQSGLHQLLDIFLVQAAPCPRPCPTTTRTGLKFMPILIVCTADGLLPFHHHTQSRRVHLVSRFTVRLNRSLAIRL